VGRQGGKGGSAELVVEARGSSEVGGAEGLGREGKGELTLAPGGTGPVHLLRTSSCPDQSFCFNRKYANPRTTGLSAMPKAMLCLR
jgi:hypothetical protein